ncbi:hypothetical protein T05_4325 [Trichinella murrelli]|uniref:Uncharacterized protein n=1 Tax=Trichinella murrelli TaxID=144512 RepID=A0A0V0TFN8_9BILA|nr:hypothetical protein T05_4325 [Trichinella murrelli]
MQYFNVLLHTTHFISRALNMMFYLEVKLTDMQNYGYKYYGTYLIYYYARAMVSPPTSRILVTTKFLNINNLNEFLSNTYNMSLKYFALFNKEFRNH